MKRKYQVTVTRYYTYEVEVDTDEVEIDEDDTETAEDIAVDIALSHYKADRSYPVADTSYDEVEAYEL